MRNCLGVLGRQRLDSDVVDFVVDTLLAYTKALDWAHETLLLLAVV